MILTVKSMGIANVGISEKYVLENTGIEYYLDGGRNELKVYVLGQEYIEKLNEDKIVYVCIDVESMEIRFFYDFKDLRIFDDVGKMYVPMEILFIVFKHRFYRDLWIVIENGYLNRNSSNVVIKPLNKEERFRVGSYVSDIESVMDVIMPRFYFNNILVKDGLVINKGEYNISVKNPIFLSDSIRVSGLLEIRCNNVTVFKDKLESEKVVNIDKGELKVLIVSDDESFRYLSDFCSNVCLSCLKYELEVI